MSTKLRTLAGVALLSLVLVACGGGGSSSSGGGSKAVNVVYTLDPVKGPDCKNTSSTSHNDDNGFDLFACNWHCANYKNQSPVWVSLYFLRNERTSNRWVLYDEMVRSPKCG